MSLDTTVPTKEKTEDSEEGSSGRLDGLPLKYLKDEKRISLSYGYLNNELGDILLRLNYNILVKPGVKNLDWLDFGPLESDLDLMAWSPGNYAYRKSFYEKKLNGRV